MTDRPFILELPDEVDPARAAPVPDPLPDGAAMQAAARIAVARSSRLTRFAMWSFSALFGFVLSVAVYDFVASLLASNQMLGTVALILTGFAILSAALLALREAATFARLARLDHLRAEVTGVTDLSHARRVVARITSLYHGRAELSAAVARIGAREGDVLDGDALLRLTEAEVMAPLDAAALREVEGAARQVATVTALVPLALADVATALFANLRMIRRVAEVYGGRSGTLGSWRLMRRVFGHLLATGAVALADDLVGSVAGGGILSKLSRRFGEGVVNGALTARVGLAAMELCRPMPFAALPRPGVTQTVSRALAGMIPRGERD